MKLRLVSFLVLGEKRKLAQNKTGSCNSWTLGYNWEEWLWVAGWLGSTLQLGALALSGEKHPVFSLHEGWETLAMKKLSTERVRNNFFFFFFLFLAGLSRLPSKEACSQPKDLLY